MMDTTLVTFMVQTSPSIQSVHLIGSWDNFQKRYSMEHDLRRGKSHWRGCYTFEDIICDGDGKHSKRTGGLKMGSKYYYYYELNGNVEFYDASKLHTTSCPYLPGQPVNFLWVPIEVQPLRNRSASMSSIAKSDIKTINPSHKTLKALRVTNSSVLTRGYTSKSAVIPGKDLANSMPSKSDKSLWSLFSLISERSNCDRHDTINLLHPNNLVEKTYTRSSIHHAHHRSAAENDSSASTTASPNIHHRPVSQAQTNGLSTTELLDTQTSHVSTLLKDKPTSSLTYNSFNPDKPRHVSKLEKKNSSIIGSFSNSSSSIAISGKTSYSKSPQCVSSSPKLKARKQNSFFTMIQKSNHSNLQINSHPPLATAELENIIAFESFKLDMGYLGNLIVV